MSELEALRRELQEERNAREAAEAKVKELERLLGEPEQDLRPSKHSKCQHIDDKAPRLALPLALIVKCFGMDCLPKEIREAFLKIPGVADAYVDSDSTHIVIEIGPVQSLERARKHILNAVDEAPAQLPAEDIRWLSRYLPYVDILWSPEPIVVHLD